jgi:hypothetical protein
MIEDDEPESDIGQSKIYSIQTGLLLSLIVHTYFDKYMIAINPDVRVFIFAYNMILTFSRIITKSPVSLETFGVMMVGIWFFKAVLNDISLFELSSNTTFVKLCCVI